MKEFGSRGWKTGGGQLCGAVLYVGKGMSEEAVGQLLRVPCSNSEVRKEAVERGRSKTGQDISVRGG